MSSLMEQPQDETARCSSRKSPSAEEQTTNVVTVLAEGPPNEDGTRKSA